MPSTGPEPAMRQRQFKTCSLSPKPLNTDPNNGDISLAVLSVLENPQTTAAAFEGESTSRQGDIWEVGHGPHTQEPAALSLAGAPDESHMECQASGCVREPPGDPPRGQYKA